MLNNFNPYTVDGTKYYFCNKSNTILDVNSLEHTIIDNLYSGKRIELSNELLTNGAKRIKGLLEIPQREKTGKITRVAICPTMQCNFRCSYCYNCQENENREAAELSDDVINKIIDDLEKRQLNDFLTVGFIGGEPLLRVPTIEKTIEKFNLLAQKRNIKVVYTMTTNASLLDRPGVIDLINKYDIMTGISFDGPEEFHDENRVDINGNGTHKRVLDSLKVFKDKVNVKHFSVRTTPSLGKDRLLKTYRYLLDCGFHDISFGFAELENSDFYGLDKEKVLLELEEFCQEVTRDLVSKKLGRFSWYHLAFQLLYNGGVKTKYCGAGETYITYDTDGDEQLCHRFLGGKNTMDFVYTPIKECETCNIKSLCGGECYHVQKEILKWHDSKERQEFACQIKKVIYNNAVAAYIKLYNQDPEEMKRKLAIGVTYER